MALSKLAEELSNMLNLFENLLLYFLSVAAAYSV
jgi:hypothetical protein